MKKTEHQEIRTIILQILSQENIWKQKLKTWIKDLEKTVI